ncbi:unnamed protein product, partial [Ranitomeya imitator]
TLLDYNHIHSSSTEMGSDLPRVSEQSTDDIVLMAQALEKIFLQKVAQMPQEEVELLPPVPKGKGKKLPPPPSTQTPVITEPEPPVEKAAPSPKPVAVERSPPKAPVVERSPPKPAVVERSSGRRAEPPVERRRERFKAAAPASSISTVNPTVQLTNIAPLVSQTPVIAATPVPTIIANVTVPVATAAPQPPPAAPVPVAPVVPPAAQLLRPLHIKRRCSDTDNDPDRCSVAGELSHRQLSSDQRSRSPRVTRVNIG